MNITTRRNNQWDQIQSDKNKEELMAKKGMKRPDITKQPKNDAPPVPEIQGKAKHGKEKVIKANPPPEK